MTVATAALGTALACAGTGVPAPSAHAASVVSIRAAAIEIGRLPAVTFQMMEQETAALLDVTGVRLRWRRAGPAGETGGDELRVVFLDGPGRGAHAEKAVLAATRSADPGPTIWVYTPTVVEALGPDTRPTSNSLATQRSLGVALGRILAHELVHVLAPGVPHGHGIMAERFRLVALDQARPALTPRCAGALARGARAWAARGNRGRTAAVPVSIGTGVGFSPPSAP